MKYVVLGREFGVPFALTQMESTEFEAEKLANYWWYLEHFDEIKIIKVSTPQEGYALMRRLERPYHWQEYQDPYERDRGLW